MCDGSLSPVTIPDRLLPELSLLSDRRFDDTCKARVISLSGLRTLGVYLPDFPAFEPLPAVPYDPCVSLLTL